MKELYGFHPLCKGSTRLLITVGISSFRNFFWSWTTGQGGIVPIICWREPFYCEEHTMNIQKVLSIISMIMNGTICNPFSRYCSHLSRWLVCCLALGTDGQHRGPTVYQTLAKTGYDVRSDAYVVEVIELMYLYNVLFIKWSIYRSCRTWKL